MGIADGKKDLKNLPEKDMKDPQAERVKGGASPIDSKRPPLPGSKPIGPIDA
jgi:hypothetical protein